MSDKRSEPGNIQQEILQDEVQDYLDMLLTQVTESPEAQISQGAASVSQIATQHINTEEHHRATATTLVRPLTMVGGTAVRPIMPQAATAKSVLTEDATRPFAEPPRPLALKMPVHALKPNPTEPEPEPEPEPKKLQSPSAPTAAPVVPAGVETGVEPMRRRSADLKSPVTKPEPEPQSKQHPPPAALQDDPQPTLTPCEWMHNGRPSWAQQRFECLLFTVGGLTLAVPLVELGTIYQITEELTPLFGQIDWFMGLLPVKNGNIKTVNTAKVVMPERYQDAMQEQFAYVVSINGVDWGLAVDKVSNAITLDPTDVRWRGQRSKRPWLAGTVVEHMCALLDVSQLAAMFVAQNRPRPR